MKEHSLTKTATVLVTGANGQLGRELLSAPAIPGLRIVGVDRASCDIADIDAIHRCVDEVQPGFVINAAAYTAVDRAESHRDKAFAINAVGAANLAAACAQAGAPLLQLSTDYVFDGSKATPWRIGDAPAPLSVYGASKLAGEDAIRAACPQHIVLRTSWVFGQYGQNFVSTMLRLAATRDSLRVVADQYGGPTWSGDLAAVLLELARRHRDGETLPWGTYHYAGEPVTSWHGFACAIVDEAFAMGMLKTRVPVHAIATWEFPTPARRPANSRFDFAETRELLGVAPSDWHAGLRRVLAAWRRP